MGIEIMNAIAKEEAHSKIAELVERFFFQIDSYKKAAYNEAQTRQDFINPFFKALGWDKCNCQSFLIQCCYKNNVHKYWKYIAGN